ncbi:MAG: SAM-dependent methyltransferase [Chitinophagaceae bacterium]|nr:SAM-dependent methyltransferase [Chitinophagaceae bacterium]
MLNSFTQHSSSYRDPSGFIFEKDGTLYRQVNISFKENFDFFIESGCYRQLTEKGLLIRHEQINENLTGEDNYYTTLKPEKISLISYPYEWSFDMLKDAALLTLRLAREAMDYGMVLKDATPYNIQWHQGKLIFIDTLSFEKFNEEPWIAYRQFCENFLGPLLIMHYSKMSLSQLQLAWPDGIPLTIIKSLLPKRSRFSFHTYLHIHLHAKVSASRKNSRVARQQFSKQKMLNLISSLEILVNKLKIPVRQTSWSGYYEEASQRKDYLEQKKKIIHEWLNEIDDVKIAADLGANEGEFSQLLSSKNVQTVAADFDPYCINRLYLSIKKSGEKNIQPIILDLSMPSPAIGVNNEERNSFLNRTHMDLVLALALVHHLAIGKNIPLKLAASFFQQMSKYLIIEFVPKADEKIQLMLSGKKDIYEEYDEKHFEQAFEKYYTIRNKQLIEGSLRVLYLLVKL